MDLKKRLASLDRLTRKPSASGLKQQPSLKPSSGGFRGDFIPALQLETEDHALGPVFYRDRLEVLEPPPDPFPDFDGFFTQPGLSGLDWQDILFLDTETTGLVGGTGTMAFVVGLAWWETGTLRTRQLFLPDPGGEAALLASVNRIARGFSAVVTFNGASFDLPLLRTRALLNRLEAPWDGLLSWDLLVPARRLWGRVLPNCRQQTVEGLVQAPRRNQQDIAGHLIPQAWFDFLQGAETATIERVLYHNWRDMVGMAAIFCEMVGWAESLSAERWDSLSSLQAWSLARIAEARGSGEVAVRLMQEAWRHHHLDFPIQHRDRFAQDLVRLLKRTGDWELVEKVIAWVLETGNNDWWIHREAAILYEHRQVDLPRARQHALSAGDEHRLQRIGRKLKKKKETS